MRAHVFFTTTAVTQLFGIQGSNGAQRGLENSADQIDFGELALDYIQSRLGGYALFYARVLEAMRLVRPGARGLSTVSPSVAVP